MLCAATEETPPELYLKLCQKSSSWLGNVPCSITQHKSSCKNPNPTLLQERTKSLSQCYTVFQKADETDAEMLINYC